MTALAIAPSQVWHVSRDVRPQAPAFTQPELLTVGDPDGHIRRIHGLQRGRIVEVRTYLHDHREIGSATWVLVAGSPAFDLRFGTWSGLPGWVSGAIGDLPLTLPIWQGLRIYSSECGLVATREGEPPIAQAYLHDLWLLHRMADSLGLLPLPAGNLSRERIPTRPVGRSGPRSLS